MRPGTGEVDPPSKPRLPAPKAVTLPPKTTALIIIDMQNDFCRPDGKLYVGQMCAKTFPRIRALLDRSREAGVPVIYSQDWHGPDDPEFKTWPAHCVANTWGAEIVDELKPTARDRLVKKVTYDVFFRTEMEDLLKELGVDTVIVTGTVSNICVMHAVAGASLRGYRVVVPIDCISALNDYAQELAIYQMSTVYRTAITASDMVRFVGEPV